MQRHVNNIANAFFHHIYWLKQVHRLLGRNVTVRLVSTFILSRLDYCNAVLAGLPKSTIAPLQRVQNALLGWWLSLDPETMSFQYFNNYIGCQYNTVSPTNSLSLLMHKIHSKRAPSYLIDRVTATVEQQSSMRLHSASTSKYQTTRTRIRFGEHVFYQDPLRGIVFPIMYNRWRTPPHSRDI